MPIRIKPIHQLKPCVITLNSIQKIIELVARDFPDATYSSVDSMWEIVDERDKVFLLNVSQREKLNSFSIKGKTSNPEGSRELNIEFNEVEAKVMFTGDPKYKNWFEHFMIDLGKHLLSPTFAQIMYYIYGQRSFFEALGPPPYCNIVIRQKPPSPFWESIKANIVSNILWTLLVFVVGVLVTLITQRFLSK